MVRGAILLAFLIAAVGVAAQNAYVPAEAPPVKTALQSFLDENPDASPVRSSVSEASPYKATLALGYTNGSIGYIPTKAAFEQGGYETEAYQYFPGARRLLPSVESVLRKEIGLLLTEMKAT